MRALAVVLVVSGVCLLAPAVGAAARAAAVSRSASSTPVRPVLGRWEGRAGRARVVFTVEATRSHQRYVVRPIVYCDSVDASWWETNYLLQPDAWPISSDGTLRVDSTRFSLDPLAGRFTRKQASLQLRLATCAGRGARFVAHPMPAAPIVPDGNWNAVLEPHGRGLQDEMTSLSTRGEGAALEGNWGVYDGAACAFFRIPLILLVNADGSFATTINGDALATFYVTAHISGQFLSPGVATGSYTLTGPGCSGQPVAFTLTFVPSKRVSGSGPFLPLKPAPRHVDYVALGDSYSAGHGVPPYDPASDVRAKGPRQDVCHRSKYAYSRQLELARVIFRRSFFACSGATTNNVTKDVQWPGEHVPQLGHTLQLSGADLVTISIGGNDVHFDAILKQCLHPHDCSGPGERAKILASATSLSGKLVETFAAVRAAVPPTTAVLALDYPQLFPAAGLPKRCLPDVILFTPAVQQFLRHAANVLDATLAAAARTAGVQFVDVRPIFTGHEICGKNGGWLNHIEPVPKLGWPPVDAGENSVHPNRAGQAGYATAIKDYLRATIAAHARLTPTGLPADPPPQP